MASLNPFTRRKKFESLIASGHRVNLTDSKAVKAVLSARQDWQDQAGDIFDAVGEVKYGVNLLSSLVSRVQIFVAEMPDNTRDAEPTQSSNALATATLDRLGDPLAISGLMEDLARNLLITGECFLVGFGDREEIVDDTFEPDELGYIVQEARDEYWEVKSIDEVQESSEGVKVQSCDSDAWIELVPEMGDTFIRIWRNHWRRSYQADSHLRGIIGACEELLWWDAASVARAKQRLGDSGFVAIPSDMEGPASTNPEDEHLTGAQRTAKLLYEASIEPISNPSSAAAASPIFGTYPANEARKSGIEHITFDRPQDDLLEKRTERCLMRIEHGINLPKGVISGLGEATHWGGGQIEESTFREHVEPLVLLILSALTKAFLHPIMKESGKDPRGLMLWYDNSNLVVHQDKSANVIRAVELGGAGWKALRRELGLSESDAPDPFEREQIREWLQSIRGSQKQGIVENPSQPTKPSDPNAQPDEPTPGKKAPDPQPSAPLKGPGQKVVASAGEVLYSRIQIMCDEKLHRALEKAGNKLKSRSRKIPAYSNALRGTQPEMAAITLGREAVIKLGIDDLFTGSFDAVPIRFNTWCTEVLGPGDYRAGEELREELLSLAAAVMFQPYTEDILVPMSLVENAVFRFLASAKGSA